MLTATIIEPTVVNIDIKETILNQLLQLHKPYYVNLDNHKKSTLISLHF